MLKTPRNKLLASDIILAGKDIIINSISRGSKVGKTKNKAKYSSQKKSKND